MVFEWYGIGWYCCVIGMVLAWYGIGMVLILECRWYGIGVALV